MPCSAQNPAEIQARKGLPHFLSRAEHGETLRVAYLGGSITAAEGWRPLSLQWFASAYPRSRFLEINAAVSGTGSELGAFRLERDVLQFKPDLMFVEFAVNDEDTPPQRVERAVEGIVRQTWQRFPQTDICFLYTANKHSFPILAEGKNPPAVEAMDRVAAYYGIPSINVGLPVAGELKAGRLVLTGPPPSTASSPGTHLAFSADGTHPYAETGHHIYLQTIQHAFESMRKQPHDASPRSLGKPMDEGNLSQAQEIRPSQVRLSGDWTPAQLADPTGQMERSLPQIWAARKAGDSLSFDFTGTLFGIYGVKGPDAAQFSIQIDRNPPIQQTLFDPYSTAGRYRCRSWISQELSPGTHHVVMTVLGPVPNKEKILKHTGTMAPAPMSDKEPFALYVGAVLINGRLVESPLSPHRK